jgi:hypothetical protein
MYTHTEVTKVSGMLLEEDKAAEESLTTMYR